MAKSNSVERVKMSLQEAADKVGISKARMRQLSLDASTGLKPFQEFAAPGVNIKITFFWADEFNQWLETRKATGGGNRGGKRATPESGKAYVVHLTDVQVAQLKEMGIETQPRYNYDPDKSKAYRQERKQKAIAAMAGNVGNTQAVPLEQQQAELAAQGDEAVNSAGALTERLDALLADD